MTQAPGQAAAPAAPAPAAPVPVTAPAPVRVTEDVPQLLNRLQVAAVSICLVFGVLAALVQFLAWQAGDRAAANTEQLVRVQDIETSLYRADALATNAYLSGGLEPAEQRAEYDAAIERVLEQLTAAADAQPADRDALAALSSEVNRYTTAITQARDNNRQAFPVGKAYLAEASKTLRERSGLVLGSLIDANTERAEDEMDAQHPWWLLFLAVLALAALWWVNRQIAMRFHRRFNRGLVVAALAIVVVTFFTVTYASSRNGSAEELRDGEFTLATREAAARTAANDAKAAESKRLIDRASGETAEESWAGAAAVVDRTTSVTGPWQAYKAAHAEVVELDDGGDWDAAVERATTGAEGSTATFDEFDQASAEVIAEAGDTVASELRDNSIGLVLTLVTLLVGLLGAAAATWGVNQRRREYS